MKYSLLVPFGRFEIRKGRDGWNLWLFGLGKPQQLRKFDSPEEAACSVAKGKTGLDRWDNIYRDQEVETEGLSSLSDWDREASL